MTARLLIAAQSSKWPRNATLPWPTATGRKLDALRGRKLTIVDASSLVILEARCIPTAWGTDHHLGFEGAVVRPGPSRR